MARKPQDDLRYKKTERLIQETFRELMKEKEYSQITIKELSQRAEINRKTFYLHYASMDELLLKMQYDVIERFLIPIRGARIPDDLEKVVRNCYERSKSADVLDRKILNSKGCLTIENPYTEENLVIDFDQDRLHVQPEQIPFLTAFIYGCITELYRAWVWNGRKEPMEAVIQLTIRLILRGILT